VLNRALQSIVTVTVLASVLQRIFGELASLLREVRSR